MELTLGRPLPSGRGRVSQWFGARPAAYARYGLAGHNGVDYAAETGTPVLAAHPGTVDGIGNDPGGYGQFVKLLHPAGHITLYGHLSWIGVVVGESVAQGQMIGAVGSTGNSTGPHLHFELRVKGMANPAYGGRVDPAPFRD